MNKVMVFRHDNSDLEFRLEPMNVPDTVTIDNVGEWLLDRTYKHVGDVFTIIEVGRTMTYTTKQKPPKPQPTEYYIEEVPEFSIFNHEQNGRG